MDFGPTASIPITRLLLPRGDLLRRSSPTCSLATMLSSFGRQSAGCSKSRAAAVLDHPAPLASLKLQDVGLDPWAMASPGEVSSR